MFIKQISIKSKNDKYPFIPLITNANQFVFNKPVTIFCGDNGSGKSTFAKILSTLSGCVYVAQSRSPKQCFVDAAPNFVLQRTATPKRKFYFSAEEFLGFIVDIQSKKQEALLEIERIDNDETMSDFAKTLAKGPHYDTIYSFDSMYGDIQNLSHGQGFLSFFESRLGKDGLYIIDEPEAALSFENQYLLAYRIAHAAKHDNCQFIICTHSPIVCAIPNADIYQIDDDEFVKVQWEEVDNVQFLQTFLAGKDKMFDE